MIAPDTSVLVAATLEAHEHHALARHALRRVTHVPAPCLAETWSVLTRAFMLTSEQVARVVLALDERFETFAPGLEDYRAVFATGRSLGLSGNIHDAVIVAACASRSLALVTLDRGQARLAQGQVDCELLLPGP